VKAGRASEQLRPSSRRPPRLPGESGGPRADLVLVGGQAVNLWASYYERRVPEVTREAPFTSRTSTSGTVCDSVRPDRTTAGRNVLRTAVQSETLLRCTAPTSKLSGCDAANRLWGGSQHGAAVRGMFGPSKSVARCSRPRTPRDLHARPRNHANARRLEIAW
jgi:hypothetical protein